MNDDVDKSAANQANKSAAKTTNDSDSKIAEGLKEAIEGNFEAKQINVTKMPNAAYITNAEFKPKSNRGFAGMSLEKRVAISRLGGASIPADKRSFSVNPKLAAEAGRKGGKMSKGGGRHKKNVPTES